MAAHELEREDALWRQQESFGWTSLVSFDWTKAMRQERQARDEVAAAAITTTVTTNRPSTAPNKWTSRLLKIPSSTKKRGMPKGVHKPRPTRGTSVRFLSTRRNTTKNDNRFNPQYSPYYTASPYVIQAPPISNQVKHPIPPLSGGDTLPSASKEWLDLNGYTMHGGKRSRGLSSTKNAKIASSAGLLPPKPTVQSMDLDLSSATSRMTHARMLGRKLSFKLNYPKKIMSNIRGDLHVLMLKHSFVPIPPKNWPIKKKIGRREGCRVVTEWHGSTQTVFNLLREMNIMFDSLLYVTCKDFYLLERGHMYCRTFQEGSMPVLQKYKLITLDIVVGEGTVIKVEESPLAKAERVRKYMITFNQMEKLRIQEEERFEKKEFMRKIKARALLFKGPSKPPMESLSIHKRTSSVDLTGGSRTIPKKPNEKNGPGSFIKPLAMGKQLETNKRNTVNIVSLTSIEARPSPEKHVPEGMRIGVGPAHYDISRTMKNGPQINLGPGFSNGNETPEHIVCKKLYRQWNSIDQLQALEQNKVDKEMERIKKREQEVLIMARGLRKITSNKNDNNQKKKKKRKKKKKIVIPERIGW